MRYIIIVGVALAFLALAIVELFAMSEVISPAAQLKAMQAGSTCWTIMTVVQLVIWIRKGDNILLALAFFFLVCSVISITGMHLEDVKDFALLVNVGPFIFGFLYLMQQLFESKTPEVEIQA